MTAPAAFVPAVEGIVQKPRRRTARRVLVLAAVIVSAPLAVGTWQRGFALPSAPEEIWVRIRESLDPKPWAFACAAPCGEAVPLGGWFEPVHGGPAAVWDERLVVRLECPTPPGRELVHHAVTLRGQAWTTVARYRNSGEVRELGEDSWGRYVRFE